MDLPKSLQILSEACAQNGVAFQVVDEFSGFVARLTKGGKSLLSGAAGVGLYPLNRAASFAVARDKAFTHYLLKQNGFAVPEGEHFFLHPPDRYVRPPGRDRADAFAYAQTLSEGYARPLVVKPNAGKGAKLVTFVGSEAELSSALDAIAQEDELALVQRFIDAPEFRLFLVDGEIAFAYRKTRSAIIGDGKRSIRKLCQALAATRPEAFAGLADSSYLRAQLAARRLGWDDVLPAGESLTVDFVSNISAGGQFSGFLAPGEPLRDFGRRIARTVSLRVTGIDIFSYDVPGATDDVVVTDVNGSPNLGTLYDMGHKDLVFDVWRSILRKTFDEPWPQDL